MLRCEVIALHQPKLGNDAGDYEDAFAFGPMLSPMHVDASHNGDDGIANANAVWIGGERAHVAIADGATESSFSGMWATMLTRTYRKGEMQSVSTLRERTELLSQRWQHSLAFRRLPWYAEEKARMGAFSTLLGLTITSPSERYSGMWWALAVGDSCLFHLRGDALITSFPIHQSSEFGNSPALLSSNLARNARVWENVATVAGEWQENDTFILATDAAARWLLTQCELSHQPWDEILHIANSPCAREDFAVWLADCRARKAMKNDDVTCLVLRL